MSFQKQSTLFRHGQVVNYQPPTNN